MAMINKSTRRLSNELGELREALQELRDWIADSFPVNDWPNGLMNRAESVLAKLGKEGQ